MGKKGRKWDWPKGVALGVLGLSFLLGGCAGCLLAVYNGELRGGTAATVRYAQRLGRRLIVLDPDGLFL